MKWMLIIGLLLSPAALAAPAVVTVPTSKSVAEAYQVVNANVIRCYAEGEYVLSSYPGSDIQPPKILINGRWMHKFSVVDIAPTATGAAVTVKLVYKLGRDKRSEEWKRALGEWLDAGRHEFCPALP